MPAPGKAKKGSGKAMPKVSAVSQATTTSAETIPSNSGEDPVKRAESLKEKALKDGERLRNEFWENLRAASSEPAKVLDDEEKKKLAVGIALYKEIDAKVSLEKAHGMLADKQLAEAHKEVTSAFSVAVLDETLMGELYQLRGKIHYQQKEYMLAIRDLSMAKHLFVEKAGETTFHRMLCYIDLNLPNYATLDYDYLAEHYSEYPNLKSYKSKVTGPLPHDFQKLMKVIQSAKQLPPGTSLLDLVKVTIVIALVQDFDFEELGKFLYMFKTAGYRALSTPLGFGAYLRDVFAATDMEDISETFTHFIPEHTVPVECDINEVMDAVQVMGEGCHLVHQIGYAMCFSLAWTPDSMWNLHSTLFYAHHHAKFDWYRALWHEYHAIEIERIDREDDDLSYFLNGGIGELPPPHARIDYLYVTDHGASDYVRLHAVATAHKNEAVLKELAAHVPLNTFHVTLAPMIFAAARDAMPESVQFMMDRGAEINIMDAAEETPLDASRVALEFRLEMLHDHGCIIPVEEFQRVQEILLKAGGKSLAGDDDDNMPSGFAEAMHQAMRDGMMGEEGDEDDEDDEEHPYNDYPEDEEDDENDMGDE